MIRCKCSDLCTFLNGYSFKSKNYTNNGIRVIRIANVQKGKIVDSSPCFYPIETEKEIEKYLLNENDLLISLTGNVGRTGLISKELLPAGLNQRVACLRINNANVLDYKYLYYCFQQNSFENDCIRASNGVAQLNLSPKWLENYEIPLPPLEEQERIVQKIEELFSHLDKGIEELKTVQAKLKVYRQAVLKEAFEGAEKLESLADVCEHITDGDHQAPPQARSGIPFIMISNIKKNKIDFSSTKFVLNEYYEQISNKRVPMRGDVLYSVVGSYGIPVLIDYDFKFCFQRHIALLRPKKIESKYLFYVLQTNDVYTQATNFATGTAQKTVSLGGLRKIKIPICKNQNKIVEEIEARLSICDSVEETIKENLIKAENLKQAILQKAFKGELV